MPLESYCIRTDSPGLWSVSWSKEHPCFPAEVGKIYQNLNVLTLKDLFQSCWKCSIIGTSTPTLLEMLWGQNQSIQPYRKSSMIGIFPGRIPLLEWAIPALPPWNELFWDWTTSAGVCDPSRDFLRPWNRTYKGRNLSTFPIILVSKAK